MPRSPSSPPSGRRLYARERAGLDSGRWPSTRASCQVLNLFMDLQQELNTAYVSYFRQPGGGATRCRRCDGDVPR